MKMLKMRFFLTCVFLLMFFSINRISASDHFYHALKIYHEGKFFEASIEFERAIFYENDSNRITVYKYYKSLCYKGLGSYDQALKLLNNINMESLPDSLYLVFRYEQVLCSYLNKDLNQALSNIDRIYKRYKDTSKIIEFLPLNIICLNACREWDNAQTIWNFYIDNVCQNDSLRRGFKNEISNLYENKNLPKFYSAKKAENLSTFLPGSGQIYCGAVVEGALNMLINMALLYYSFDQLYNNYYLTGYFTGLKLFNRFYSGGIRRAKFLTTRKNEEVIKAFNIQNSALMTRLSSMTL